MQQSLLGAMKDMVKSDPFLATDFPDGSWEGEIPSTGVKPLPRLVIKSIGGEIEETFEAVYLETAKFSIEVTQKSEIRDELIAHVKKAFDWKSLDNVPGSAYGLDTRVARTVRIMPNGEPTTIQQEERAEDNQVLYVTSFEYEVTARRVRS